MLKQPGRGRFSIGGSPRLSSHSDNTPPKAPRPRILIAGGERHILRLIEVNLQRAGFPVVAEHDLHRVVEIARAERPDRIVLDLWVAGVGGLSVARELKEDPNTSAIPVAVLLRKEEEPWLPQDWHSYVECLLFTPFDPQRLIRFLR